MSLLRKIYYAIPPQLRSVAATLHGYRLKRLRYGSDLDSLVGEALAAERLPCEELARRQAAELAKMLDHAAQHVPYYRNFWNSAEAKGRNPLVLTDWPILEKETLRTAPEKFLADGISTSQLVSEHTSGTSGKPLHLWWSKEATRRHYALFEARWRRWYGVSRRDHWAILGGQLVAPVEQTQPPFWVWNAASNQLYLSSYHLAPHNAGYYFDELRRRRVRYLWGYTSSLFALAQDALAAGVDDLRMVVAITNAEPLSPWQREIISAAFHCPVRETYGMAELVACAGECEAGRLHTWPETGLIEILANEKPVAAGRTGDLVCTGLLNDAMPLIRYRLGDCGAWDDDATPCSCGRTLLRLKAIEGRKDDVLLLRDGRRIGRLDTVFKADWPIREAQIIQEQLDTVRLRYVPAQGYTNEIGDQMTTALQARMGNVKVILEPVTTIPRTANGKFRAVICALSSTPSTSVAEARL